MKVAILVLGLIGSIMALALGACAGASAPESWAAWAKLLNKA